MTSLKKLKKDIEGILLLKSIYTKKGTPKRVSLEIELIHKRDELLSLIKIYADEKHKEGKKEGKREGFVAGAKWEKAESKQP